MRGVALTQRKGGSGKTALSHALALGASWDNVPAHLMHTDNREPLKVNGRPYMYYDARNRKPFRRLSTQLSTRTACALLIAPETARSLMHGLRDMSILF